LPLVQRLLLALLRLRLRLFFDVVSLVLVHRVFTVAQF